VPQQQIIPTWLAWNNADFSTASGVGDRRTGENFSAGGLGLGDYFDATEKEANAGSYLPTGLLHWGRYRLVQVDSGATAANVKTGTPGFIRQGSFLQGIQVFNAGSGGTPGTYTIPFPAGLQFGSGGVIQVVVGAAGSITSASVLQGGQNYVGAFLIPATLLTAAIPGLTGQVLYTQMGGFSPNLLTSFDQLLNVPGQSFPQTRPFVFLNSITPGNFGFVQELGLATCLAGSVFPFAAPSAQVVASSTGFGTGAVLGVYHMGASLDWAQPGQLFRMIIQFMPPCQD